MQPAVQLAGRLLDTVGRGWAQRVFYSDDGSTAIEVALKMAFRKYMHDHGLTPEPGAGPQSVPELQVCSHFTLHMTKLYTDRLPASTRSPSPMRLTGDCCLALND